MKVLNKRDRAKVTTMTSDQVRAMVERGERLPEGLSVSGGLYLRGCTALTSLPNRLSVGESLDLQGCTGLTSLPEGLSVGGWLNLAGCTGLTSLPRGLSVGWSLHLQGCTGLTSLPDEMSLGEGIYTQGCTVKQSCVMLEQQLPETVMISLVGRRLGTVLRHRLIANPAFDDAIITAAIANDDNDCVWIYCDRDLMQLVAMPTVAEAA